MTNKKFELGCFSILCDNELERDELWTNLNAFLYIFYYLRIYWIFSYNFNQKLSSTNLKSFENKEGNMFALEKWVNDVQRKDGNACVDPRSNKKCGKEIVVGSIYWIRRICVYNNLNYILTYKYEVWGRVESIRK